MKKSVGCLAILVLFIGLAGCATLLPSSKTTITSPWTNLGDMETAYEKIIPGQTTINDLKKMGIDPYKNPNIKILTIAEIITLYMPNQSIQKEDLDEGLQKCIKAKSKCRAYQIEPGIVDDKHTGNFWLDSFNFKTEIKKSGWNPKILIVIIDDVVVYKEPISGKPLIDEKRVEKNPLGPFQKFGDWIIGLGKSLMKL